VGVAAASRSSAAWRKTTIAGLLRGQRPDGSFGVHPYSKWTGAHWRLVSLVELGVPRSNAAARAAARTVLDWVATRSEAIGIKGRERRHASIEGNALAVCCRLGMARDLRVQDLVDVLLRSQWPDGGWNCDRHPGAHRSSFYESLAPIWGLVEYHRATGFDDALAAANRTGELLLEHRLFRAMQTGHVIESEWLHIHWPHYWHYDFFHGLRAIAMLGRIDDSRAAEARQVLLGRRSPKGTWRVDGRRYWRRATEAVDWGDAHEVVTRAALAMLQ
jgi:hypothetical protein